MSHKRGESSFSDWESVNEDDVGVQGGSPDERQVVLELPPEGLCASGVAADEAAASKSTAKYTGNEGSAAGNSSSISSFVPVSRFDSMSMQTSELPSAASSSSLYESLDDGFSLSSSFDILSLSSGELVRRCKRCKFHNSHDSFVCASCELALVANPNIDIDAQIAMHLQQKEEQDARAILQEAELEAEQKRRQICQDPFYEHARILNSDIREACDSFMSFQTLPNHEDLEGQVLNFVKQAVDLPSPKTISFAFKCTHHTSLEYVRTNGLPRNQVLSITTDEVEVSHSLEDALVSFETLQTMSDEPLRPIPEDGMEQTTIPSCLCWIVAILQSADSNHGEAQNVLLPPSQTLPLAYFDSRLEVDLPLYQLLGNLQRTFITFFQENLDLPIFVTDTRKLDDNIFKQPSEDNRSEGSASMESASSPPNENKEPHFWGQQDDSGGEVGHLSEPAETGGNKSSWSLKLYNRINAIAAVGSSMVICCNDRDVYLYKESRVNKRLLQADTRVSCLASAPSPQLDGHLLAIGDINGVVSVYKIQGDEVTAVQICNPESDENLTYNFLRRRIPILDIRFLPSGNSIAFVNRERECQLWSLIDGTCECRLRLNSTKLTAACFSPDGNTLASIEEDKRSIDLWKLQGELHQLTGHESSLDVIGRREYRIRALAFSADGNYLASAGNDLTIRLWDIQRDDIQCTKVIRVPVPLSSLTFSPDSTLLAGGGGNGSVQVWNVSTRSDDATWTLAGNKGSIKSLMFLPDGKTLVSVGCTDCIVRFWSLG